MVAAAPRRGWGDGGGGGGAGRGGGTEGLLVLGEEAGEEPVLRPPGRATRKRAKEPVRTTKGYGQKWGPGEEPVLRPRAGRRVSGRRSRSGP